MLQLEGEKITVSEIRFKVDQINQSLKILYVQGGGDDLIWKKNNVW